MWKLLQKIAKEDEQDLYLGTNDIFRPDLKQIGNSLFEIRSYYIKKDSYSIAPNQLSTPLAKVKERLIEHIESHACDFRFDPLTNEVVDFPNPKVGPCFMFASHSLSVALDFYTSPRPSNTVCDVFLALPTQSVIVLSLIDGDEDSPEAVAYSISVARGVTETLTRFTDEDINSIHGVIHTSLLDDTVGFKNRLKTLAKESSHFITNDSLGMTPSRYEKVLTAFWAGVTQTKSVLKEETGDTDGDCLRFLTKEQCIILVENINSKNVEVKCVPGSGATTLMLEVARRLNRLGDTLLVCRSRQERDRLRSVYPSAVAAEDLTTMDMPSCVNIVDETNTVVAQTSGQHWQFTSYQAEVKERTSQIMEAKLQNISKQEEQDLYLGTNDIFRPDLKQIGDSVFEIRSYFVEKDGQSIAPKQLSTPLAKVKERLIEHIESHACDFRFDPITFEVVDFPNPKAGPCFMFISHSLSVALDFYTSPRPSSTVCDVFLALPTQSVIVLSLVVGDEDSPEAVAYSMSVARGVIETLSRFTDEDINSIHGVIHTSLLDDPVGFKNRLKTLANESSHFVTNDSLGMTPSRYEKVLTAFWAGVAQTKSVLKEETGDTDGDCLRFLTKEQCIILVENINSKNVEVKCVPGSGATTLMLEVARRLNRLGDTLLVCRSRQERDRLRSVYPSAVAAEDLTTMDMPSCVNIVDETNTVVAQTSGQHWQFTSYQAEVKERTSQIMEAKLQNISKQEEQDLYLGTNDIFRPDLKQIGDSVFEIRSYFVEKDGQSIAPKQLSTPLAKVKERLIEHIESHACDFRFDPLTFEVVDFPNPKAGPCFMFISHSLSVALDFYTSPRPSSTVCDVFLALPTQSVIVLSLVDGDEDSPEAVAYSMSVARGVIETLSRFTDEDINSIHGVIHTSLLDDTVRFKNRLKTLANESSHFVTNDSLGMTPSRYEKVLTAFWAGVAETKSVLKEETGDTDGDCLRFLTKEQCIILVENINSKNVEVKCVPGSGATTLMLEVARRLNRLGDTLLVCRSRQERDRLRSVYPSAVAAEDLTTMDMPSCVNIVDETNTVVAQTSGQHWQFTSYQAEVKERTSQIMEAKLQNISKQEEQDLYLGTNDIFRPDLKQIGDSVFEIRSYFVEKDGQSIAPKQLSTPLAKVKERLIEHIESHACDFRFDPLTFEVVDFPNPKAGPCFMFISHSLSVALDFYTSPRPSSTVCDVFLALPTQSVIVLSLVVGDEDSPEAVAYSMSVARGVIETLSRFTDEDINSIHGVIHTSLLDDTVRFKNRLKTLANESSHFVTNDSLGMTPSRYEKVLTAFWAGVAQTKSVLKEETGDTDGDCLRFLTKEQCIILVENINSKNVEVKCVPGSGATTLMLEVARRLNRLGDTLLVCRSRQERDRLRSVYPSAVAAEDLTTMDMPSCVNIVDETNTVVAQTSGQHWQFTSYQAEVKERTSQIMEAKLQNISKQEEQDLYLGTNDIFRPDLEQIGDTLLVCRSRQERDKLRSVYPSAVAAEDLTTVDMPSCVNIVDETNTVVAQTSGQHWQFTSYQAEVKERTSQIMEAKLQNISKQEEQDLYLGTNDIFRPDLKQIGDSVFEIRSYFVEKDGQSIAPKQLSTPLAKVKERLIEHIESHACDFRFDPITFEVVDFPNPKAGPCFMFISHSLSVALDFYTSPRPSSTVCDVFLALPTQSVIVLSLVVGDEDSPEAVAYSMSVARGVIETLSRFTDEDINSIHGVIHTSLLDDPVGFKNRLKTLANESSHFVTNDSLGMTPSRYEKVLTAFWAGVAQTKSVLKEETGDTDGDCLRFLTKEQCIILVENINSKNVEVKCVPGSGATTLMLEVARRLNRLGDTLLVCRSRQERDRLRSVYPSAVAAEDLTTMDMPSCVNIVDETNTVVAQTSGQHWQFTSYQAEVKERTSQIMEAKLQNISKQEEQDLYLGTNDIFRPDLKQIGDSVFEIRSYFVEKDGQSIAPKQLSTPLAKVKERLIEHIESHACDFRFDPLTFEVVDFPNPKAGPCFMFISHSLSVALDFYTSPRPSSTVCDVFLALPTQSVIVLSLVVGDEDSPEAVAYSMSVARGVIETLSRFTDEDINSIHGVIHTSLLDDTVGFKNRLKTLANESSHFVTNDSLGMTPSRYEKVLTAFWAGVAQTKSVLKEETGDTDGDCLRFLTKEQCIILVENINSKNVEVKCVPGSGATTLMLEVARRLNRLGDTLLVCRSRQERDRLRSVYPSAVAAEDLTTMDMPSCVNIVDETNTVVAQTSGQHWQFTSYQAEVKERTSQIMEAKLQNISKQEEQDLYLGTNDIFRPDLKQIGDSVFEIRSYFVEKDGQSIAPKQLSTPLAKVKERLIEHIESHACDFRFDPLTFEVVDFPNPKAGPCFMFISHSLSVALDFYTSPRPSSTVCDVFLALPTQSVIVLSLVVGDEDSPEAVAYSMSVARGVIETLSRFTDEDINSIHGVIHTSLLDDTVGFKNRLKTLANESSHFVTNDSLGMTPSRYEKVLTAFWAGVAQTKSVLKEETGDTDGDCLRFLTKEQCIILVENINSKNVEVKCVPGSGATTLMLEVARRLNRLGDTLLVCRSRQERDRLRSVYPSAVAAEDLTTMDMPSCVNIVDETNTVVAQTSGQHWQFTSYQAEVKERTSQIMEAKLQNISKQEEQDLYLGTNDIFRPDLEQIGDTLLVCRSRQERDKLRSVYPSAVAAEDLTTMDMPSCVNIVDETNTVVAQTSGQHWQFTSYQAEVKERMPQIMEEKLQNISKQDEQDLYLGTNDIFRPDLKQIRNSVFEIRKYFVEKDDHSIAPTTLSTPLAKVKERIIELIDIHAYDFIFDPLTNEVVDFPNQKGGPYFMFVSHSLSVALDFYTSPRPSNTVCDVLLALPTQSVIVLSLVDGDEDSPEAVAYSMSVARGVIETLSRFTDEDINSIHGVIHTSLLDDTVRFKNRLKTLANESSHFVTNDSLGMTPSRYEKVLTAFWAGVAETKSVLKEETGDTDGDCLRFLTKEQCIILVENINSKNVEVKCVPGSGATTLMLEVARRLNRLGDTLLVCRSRQERDRLRSVYPSVIAAEDLSMVDMSSCVNIVDETNTVVAQTSGQHWQFKTYLTDIKELKNQILGAEMEIEVMEKQIDALSNESWMERIEYLLRDFSVLKMLSFKLGSTEPISAHEVRHDLEYKQGPLRTSKGQNAALGGLKHMSATRALWLSDLHDGLRQRENIVPLFRSAIIQDKTHRIYQGVKNVLLRKALGEKKHAASKQSLVIVGHVESPDIQQQMEMFHIEPENARKESDIPTVRKEYAQIYEMETEVQDTDGKDLENLELQAAVEYLARHKGDLSMLDIEIPGLQVFQGGQDRHESTFPGRVTSVQGTSAVSTVGYEEIGEEVGPSKRKGRRLDISGSATSLLQSHDRNIGRDEGQRLTRAPGLISQLRQYQQGRLTEKHLCAITMKIIRDDELQLKELMANNDCLEKDFGNTVHVVGLTRRPLLVSCPKLHLDAARAIRRQCHVTPDGELVNRWPDTRNEGKDRLRKYRGTCSSPIPLPPPSSTLTPLPTTPRYWETETRVRVVGGCPVIVLEMGVCEAGQVDSKEYVYLQRRSWSVRVGSCGTHREGICTRVYREGERGECHQDTMSPTPGTQYTLHYGIVLDVGRGRAAFTDLDRQVVLDKFNVEFREPLVPMFSVGWEYMFFDYTASMRLISGEDINMTDTKKALIYQALN